MVVLFALMFSLQMQLPKKFEWQSTYHHADRQPFGCYVFDSVLAESMPKGYQVTSKNSASWIMNIHLRKSAY